MLSNQYSGCIENTCIISSEYILFYSFVLLLLILFFYMNYRELTKIIDLLFDMKNKN
jgi:hypothetical protein